MSHSLFTGVHQRQNFCRIPELFSTTQLTASSDPFSFPVAADIALPDAFEFDGVEVSVERHLADTATAALLVIHDGTIRTERYASTGGPDVGWLSMSVAKSFVSTLVGIAVGDGSIASIDDPVDAYVPEVAGSAYVGVSIRDVLQMSSGAAWNEDYSDRDSDVRRLGRAFRGQGTLAELVGGIEAECPPGTRNHYNSAETQVLGFLLARTTGQTVTDYMQSRLWDPLGMEHPGHWITDSAGVEMAFAGLSATAVDYAKLGQLFLDRGMWRGRQIVPADWATAAVTPDAPHLMPGRADDPDFGLGYGYQWWIPDGDVGEFTAIGVYNQFVYVDPSRRCVVVKLSANPTYGVEDDEEHNCELASIELFRRIARSFDA